MDNWIEKTKIKKNRYVHKKILQDRNLRLENCLLEMTTESLIIIVDNLYLRLATVLSLFPSEN